MRQDKKARRSFNISWWKLIVGVMLVAVGILAGYFYLNNVRNVGAGMLAVFTLASGVLLVYLSLKASAVGFSFRPKGKRKYSGRENAIVFFARRNSKTEKDIPVIMSFLELNSPPKDARLHYVRNYKKHYYELYNNPKTKKLEPVALPDKKSSPPELYQIPATMQPYKDCMDYNPPTLLQKVAPGILLIAMGIVGFLMLVTGG